MQTDLHIHSIYSDGEKTVLELIKDLEKNKIELFSITDHDCLDACYELKRTQLPKGMHYVAGVELSSVMNGINCHILGYHIDPYQEDLTKHVKFIQQARKNRLLKIIAYLKAQYSIELNQQEIELIINKKGTLGKPDLLKVLLTKKQCSVKEIYQKYLKELDFGSNYREEVAKNIALIRKAGGVAILAHPKEIEEEYNISIEQVINKFIYFGLGGIEVYNNIHTPSDVTRYLELANHYGLITTGGSDYHGPIIKPHVELGATTTEKIKIKTKDMNYTRRMKPL